jgi:hypothetical protein
VSDLVALLTSPRELWASWLGYRLPHWDALERAAAACLSGAQDARVRVGWDSSTGSPAEWHATLFTLTAETPEPGRVVEAAREYKPAGFLLHHVISDERHPHGGAPPDPRPADLARVSQDALAARRTVAEFEADPRCGTAAIEHRRQRSEALVKRARAAAELAITDGLMARNGTLLLPPMVVKPEMAREWLCYRLVLEVRAALAPVGGDPTPWRPRGIAVCRACTSVFVPRGRKTGEYCRLCRKRPAEPFVVGQRPLERGSSQPVRVPKLAGDMVLGWTATTIGMCPDCGTPFASRRDATACPDCASRVRQRRYRSRLRARTTDAGDDAG